MQKIVFSFEDIAEFKGEPLDFQYTYVSDFLTYKGYASTGSLTSETKWWITKYNWASGFLIQKQQWSEPAIWDNADSLGWSF